MRGITIIRSFRARPKPKQQHANQQLLNKTIPIKSYLDKQG